MKIIIKAWHVPMLLLLSAMSYNMYAEPEYSNKTVIFFGNGVLTSQDAARFSLKILQRDTVEKITGTDLEGEVSFQLAYNPTAMKEGVGVVYGIADIYEAVTQTFQLLSRQFWQLLAGIGTPEDQTNFVQTVSQWIAETVDEDILSGNPAAQQHVDIYDRLLKECKKVVVVAHSQGNLFANIAHLGVVVV